MLSLFLFLVLWTTLVHAYHYDIDYVAYNLNTNRTARDPSQYWGQRYDHTYMPSPSNWRFPVYTLMLDRFVNGDPFNDNVNGTYFEKDINSNQMRHGGDLRGLNDSLDYLQGGGIKGIYLAGSVLLNLPWVYDGYSPVDLSLLDPHHGYLATWHSVVDAIHERGMYVMLDNTFATLGDLLGFQGYLNQTAPFDPKEHQVEYKTNRRYLDFDIGSEYNATCDFPRFWNETGYPVDEYVNKQFTGCYNGEFDQFGDTEAFGVYPDYRRQLTKFASVQDRLREWHVPTRKKLERFYCMLIAQLDIDGFRFDKAMQSTVDAFAEFNFAMRQCARQYGKNNFLLAGEITSGNDIGSVWIGRGRQPDMLPPNLTAAVTAGFSTQEYSLRPADRSNLDAGAFHYSVYRTLTRFLGMDGNLEAGYDVPLNLVDMWNTLLITNDLTNANTGQFDPRHMYGTVNPDVFRWPAIKNGTHRQLLASFVTTLMLPGIPLTLWGEEQSFYILDNTASNYIFGRQAMSASSAWQTHGCYSLDSTQYYQYPVESARQGCHDATVSYDHRDPSAPVRNIYKHMYYLRERFPVLNDGGWLQQLSNQTENVYYPGSTGLATETGLWSVMRSGVPNVQNFTDDTPIWLLYSNSNATKDYEFNCANAAPAPHTTALLSPYDGGTTVRNLLHPYETVELEKSAQILGFNGSTNATGCISKVTMDAYGFKAYVPIDLWVAPRPAITRFMVDDFAGHGHDARILSRTSAKLADIVEIRFYFSAQLDCQEVTRSITLKSNTVSGRVAKLDKSSAHCGSTLTVPDVQMQGMIPSVWSWSGRLLDVEDGTHEIIVGNATKNSVDHFYFRIGQADNPVVFPRTANYSSTLVQKDEKGQIVLHHTAAGADLWRYSTNWGTSYSSWQPYTGEDTPIDMLHWSGTKAQAWKGDHIRVEYFNRMVGSSDIVQEGDINTKTPARRFPHLYWNGPYNEYGFDAGLANQFELTRDGQWEYQFMTEWPAIGQVNVWGMNPDGQPDQTYVLGDIDGDSVLDRLPPSSLSATLINITMAPGMLHPAWSIKIDDATRRFILMPSGSSLVQLIVFALLWSIPIVTAFLAVFAFMKGFYRIKFNQVGATEEARLLPSIMKERVAAFIRKDRYDDDYKDDFTEKFSSWTPPRSRSNTTISSALTQRPAPVSRQSVVMTQGKGKSKDHRRTVLIATMEYNIEDWNIKVKIGGLGVMAQLMGQALDHQDLIWVIPCIGGVEYPIDTPAEPMKVTILGSDYSISVQYHKLKNITFILLDAPVFRQQTQKDPYPSRMDDMTSAIYYAAWNQCIAQAIKRFPIDLYHINDYHGCLAPLYLLPRTIPVCFSLHNAEFQGLWSMRTPEECSEISAVFNLNPFIVQSYVQFGEVFNLLHAGASYLRVYQQGFGAVGVSKKYGKRTHLRYPIFWGLKKIGQLPNPDPTDTAEWNGQLPREEDIKVDEEFEKARPGLRLEAQKWAGLEEDPDAELFVFVGRWSQQKGVDLIADIFPTILKKHPKTQLICVGPVIDLYGKFAALKLEKMMKEYPKRVFSRPVFTALPPCIFSGAEFALIPSRDEPFGLVAVEFGRKGALGVGARVGGLGNMPGWWFTVEAMTTAHLIHQFRMAIEEALSSKQKTRAVMRARSAKQRFPVAQWVESLDILQTTAIRIHGKDKAKEKEAKRKANRLKQNSKLSLTAIDSTPPHAHIVENLDTTPERPIKTTSFGLYSPVNLPNDIEADTPSSSSRLLKTSDTPSIPEVNFDRPTSPVTPPTSSAKGRIRRAFYGLYSQVANSDTSPSISLMMNADDSTERCNTTPSDIVLAGGDDVERALSPSPSFSPSPENTKIKRTSFGLYSRDSLEGRPFRLPPFSFDRRGGLTSPTSSSRSSSFFKRTASSFYDPPVEVARGKSRSNSADWSNVPLVEGNDPVEPQTPTPPSSFKIKRKPIGPYMSANNQENMGTRITWSGDEAQSNSIRDSQISMPERVDSEDEIPPHLSFDRSASPTPVSSRLASSFKKMIGASSTSNYTLPFPSTANTSRTVFSSEGESDMASTLNNRQRATTISTLRRPSLPLSVYSDARSDVDVPLQAREEEQEETAAAELVPSLSYQPNLPRYTSDVNLLATETVVGEVKNYQLQQVEPFFTDSQGVYHDKFSKMLDKAGALHDGNMVIEEYLLKSEKEWFQLYLNAKLGREAKQHRINDSPNRSTIFKSASASTIWPFSNKSHTLIESAIITDEDIDKSKDLESKSSVLEFKLREDYEIPRYLRNWLQLRIGDWPVYSLFLALGQIMAANSYQITLLTGQIGESAGRLYSLCGLYIAASLILWFLFRRVQSVIVLTIPFIFYGLAFFMIGLARFGPSIHSRGWIQNIASSCYALASASGSLYFSLNFGDEGGSTIRKWIFRACIIQGIQQIYITALWFWGSKLTISATQGASPVASSIITSWKSTAVCLPIAVALWMIAAVVYFGLPSYYRQKPGQVPSFYSTIFRRRIILWFFLTVMIQNFFLSAQYGRSWSFLWKSKHAAAWQIACLVIFFFIVLWASLLWTLSLFSRKHSWFLPILAVGLGAPRWAQIWWGVSGMGDYLPWTGSYLLSALLSRSLWLWLGTLDTIQSVGIGMILLATMTRFHVSFTLIAAQIIGAIMTAIARAASPNKLGPGPIFPNIVADVSSAFNAWFWIALTLNASVCIGFFLFYRKEQLTKP